MTDGRKEVILQLMKEVEGINNIEKIRFILSVVQAYKAEQHTGK